MRRWNLLAAFCAAAVVVCATPTMAQPDSPERFSEDFQDRPDPELNFAASLGMVWATGNTSSWTLNAGTQFRLVRDRHALSVDWTFAYGRTDLTPNRDEGDPDNTDTQNTVRNSNARARYDFYLSRMDALFLAVAHRWDTFAGLDTRLQTQAGYLRNLIREENHRLWGEIGYDFTYDNYVPTVDPDLIAAGTCMADELDTPACILGGQNVHAARAYVGYENKLNALVNVSAGLEALFNLQDGDDIRLNLDAALVSTLSSFFKLEVKFKLLFDNVPVPAQPALSKVDTLLTVNLVFNWEQEQPPAEPAAEEPAAEEAPAAEPAADEAEEPAADEAEEPAADEAPAEEGSDETAEGDGETDDDAAEDTAAEEEVDAAAEEEADAAAEEEADAAAAEGDAE